MGFVQDFLTTMVKPALGCTEPICVALAVAYARSMVGGEIRKVEVLVDPNIFKNGMGAGIPKTHGKIGNIYAAALGAICGDPGLCLEVLNPIDSESIDLAKQMIEDNSVVIEVLRGRKGIFVDARVITSEGIGRARIEGTHTNLTLLESNGQKVDSVFLGVGSKAAKSRMFADLKFADLVAEARNITEEDVEFIIAAILKNAEAAEFGLANNSGLGIGLALKKSIEDGLLGDDPANRAKVLTAGAVDARMGGEPVSIMAVAGSGNQGIACTLPLLAFCRFRGIEEGRQLAEATALAFMVTGYIKECIGSLGALCGCVMGAACGAAAGITFLIKGDGSLCAHAVTNVLADLSGVICDGAKGGCALKLATAANAAVQSAALAVNGVRVTEKDGIVDKDIDETIRNLGRLSNPGMTLTDDIILDIMSEKLHKGAYSS